MTKALALVSGGLDSILAAKLIKDQGIEVTGVCFKSAFFGPENAIRMAKTIDIPLIIIDFTEEHVTMTRNPKHGYGKNMNPCIDCHAMMLRLAGELMEKTGADFLITGEVLNQRPMSQNLKSLNIVKKDSGYGDRILRPLCAKNLPPTDMEKEGLVDREKLLDIMGKSRKVQMELAEKLGIKDYPSPAGGCSLTEPNYSRRLKDLYENEKEFDIKDIELLKLGRHFRLPSGVKVISTRTAEEYKSIKPYIRDNDIVFDAVDYSGSTIILRGSPSPGDISMAAGIAARYSKGALLYSVKVKYRVKDGMDQFLDIKPLRDDEIVEYML